MSPKKSKKLPSALDWKGISFSSYYHSAQRFYLHVLDAERTLKAKEEMMRKEVNQYKEANSEAAINVLIRKELSQLDDFSKAAQIFSCMALESFLNFYGVNQVGEDFYKRNFERLSPNQKLETLIAVALHVSLEKGDEICKVVHRMFEQRNRLVHPKAKQIQADGALLEIAFSSDDPVGDAKKMIDDMELFFNLFREIDNLSDPFINYLTKVDLI